LPSRNPPGSSPGGFVFLPLRFLPSVVTNQTLRRFCVVTWGLYVALCVATVARWGFPALVDDAHGGLILAGTSIFAAVYLRGRLFTMRSDSARTRVLCAVWLLTLAAATLSSTLAGRDGLVTAALGLVVSGAVLATTPPKMLGGAS
jgi:hypothetical protein